LVDYVSEEAERAGAGAAAFVRGSALLNTSITTQPGNGVRYVLPQTITDTTRDVSLFFRVSHPMGKVRCTVRSGADLLTALPRPRVAPGEMERITLSPDLLRRAGDTITVEVEELP